MKANRKFTQQEDTRIENNQDTVITNEKTPALGYGGDFTGPTQAAGMSVMTRKSIDNFVKEFSILNKEGGCLGVADSFTPTFNGGGKELPSHIREFIITGKVKGRKNDRIRNQSY